MKTPPRRKPFGALASLPLGGTRVLSWAAGLLVRIHPTVAALAIVVGHVLNIGVYILVGLLPATQAAVGIFWTGLLVETVIDLVVIWLVVALLRPITRASSPTWSPPRR